MWKCDGLFGNVSVLQQFYKLIFDFKIIDYVFQAISTIWIAHREQQFLLVIYFVLDKKESSCDIYGFSFNCTQTHRCCNYYIWI